VSGPTRPLARLLASVLLVLCLLAPGALAAAVKSESEAELQQQLAAKQVQSVVINKRTRTLRVTLEDGTQVLARYPKKQSEQTAARLRARGVSVTVLTPAEAKREAKQEGKSKKSHHKLRYIVGAAVIVVIAIVLAVLLINRRRRRD
jgi:anti-sigma-K factor RskA